MEIKDEHIEKFLRRFDDNIKSTNISSIPTLSLGQVIGVVTGILVAGIGIGTTWSVVATKIDYMQTTTASSLTANQKDMDALKAKVDRLSERIESLDLTVTQIYQKTQQKNKQ